VWFSATTSVLYKSRMIPEDETTMSKESEFEKNMKLRKQV